MRIIFLTAINFILKGLKNYQKSFAYKSETILGYLYSLSTRMNFMRINLNLIHTSMCIQEGEKEKEE